MVLMPRKRPSSCCSIRRTRPLSEKRRDRYVSVFKALADPTRIEILRLLAAQDGPVCACDIVDAFDLSQPTVSHHLKTLTKGGLIVGERNGLWMFYELAEEGIEALGSLADLVGRPARA